MAEDDDGADKTEEPSDRKKEKAREQGQIAFSKEVGSSLVFVTVLVVLYWFGGAFYRSFKHSMEFTMSRLQPWGSSGVPFEELILPAIKPIAYFIVGLMTTAFVAGIIAHIAQKGIDTKLEAAEPKLDKLSPAQGLKQLISAESFVTNLKNIVKTMGFLWIFYLTIGPHLDKIIFIAVMPIDSAAKVAFDVVKDFVIYATIFLASVAALDYFLSWRRIHTQLMMSRQEMKDEHKVSDGNPEMKSKVKQIQRERAKRQAQVEVPKATVIITNPTHFAIALKYKKGEAPVPKVVAKGVDAMAMNIREIAKKHQVPVIENPPLARALYKEVKVGKEIPSKFYKTVAKIIAAILRIEEEKKKRVASNFPTYREKRSDRNASEYPRTGPNT